VKRKKIPGHEFDEATFIHIGGMIVLYILKKDISSPGKVIKSFGVDHEVDYT
jgi:hypothetical protein